MEDLLKKGNKSLLENTGINEADLFMAVAKFARYGLENPGKPLIEFFTERHIHPKTQRVFALIGMRYLTNYLYEKEKEEENKRNAEQNKEDPAT